MVQYGPAGGRHHEAKAERCRFLRTRHLISATVPSSPARGGYNSSLHRGKPVWVPMGLSGQYSVGLRGLALQSLSDEVNLQVRESFGRATVESSTALTHFPRRTCTLQWPPGSPRSATGSGTEPCGTRSGSDCYLVEGPTDLSRFPRLFLQWVFRSHDTGVATHILHGLAGHQDPEVVPRLRREPDPPDGPGRHVAARPGRGVRPLAGAAGRRAREVPAGREAVAAPELAGAGICGFSGCAAAPGEYGGADSQVLLSSILVCLSLVLMVGGVCCTLCHLHEAVVAKPLPSSGSGWCRGAGQAPQPWQRRAGRRREAGRAAAAAGRRGDP
ncbi:unnamed protein product [Prorocentrum cordatum]|uniref:Uncharacterized protein n=1 Tax=Prorocentrum cordatum TaxID=2364126 RepID=A0ABN9R3P1_9DINO|nr:unnamed protein product [Polarella glacialis]